MSPAETPGEPDKLLLNRFAAPITTLGYGRRIGIWVQGCSIGCSGCSSVDTWSSSGGNLSDPAELAGKIMQLGHDLDGLTITGGEPLEQPEAIGKLLTILNNAGFIGPASERDVLCFTGVAEAKAIPIVDEHLPHIDALVAGPYLKDRPHPHPLIASANQVLITRTSKGSRRTAATAVSGGLQVHVSETEVHLVGLPEPGQLERITSELEQRGVKLGKKSWEHGTGE